VSEFQHYLDFFKDSKNIITRKIAGLSDWKHFPQAGIFYPGPGIVFRISLLLIPAMI
jgi:hypothetical protein